MQTDSDYLAALEHADSVQRSVYEREAAEIDRLQKDILAIVQNEKPFDVFICYKETDAGFSHSKRHISSACAGRLQGFLCGNYTGG